MSIQFFFIDTAIKLTERKRLKAYLESIFKKFKTPLNSLTVVFCTDDYLLEINKQFLNHDYYTDIITFNLAEGDDPIEGDVYISIDRVKDNSTNHHVNKTEELHRVIFHGVLHLCGFLDKSIKDKAAMTNAEDECLAEYFR